MTLLDVIVEEYITIVELLTVDNLIENDRIIIDREEFRTMLDKYAFATFTKKTKIYKELNFIIHDGNNYTMPYKDKELGKTIRKVIINYKTYKTIKGLYDTVFD